MFLFNGGDSTTTSYGVSRRNSSPHELLAAIPKDHLEFFKRLEIYYLMEPFLCVHGGIHPAKSLDAQIEKEMLWIRDEFIHNKHALPYTVLFGHTPRKEVLFHLPYKVGLDTGLVYGNVLSCLEVTKKVLFQIRRGKNKVTQKQVRDRWD